jgi:mannose-1-phosphate guanylyltransferase
MENLELDSAAVEIKKIVDEKTDLFVGEMYGIVSAGGRGTRLRPKTLQLPKPLLEVGRSKRPLIYWSMLPMIIGGISRFIVGVRYDAHKIEETLGSGEELSREFGKRISIDYIEEPAPLGRAGFIKYGLEKGIVNPDKPAILFNASDILRLNLRELVRHYLWLSACHGCQVVQVYTSGFKVRFGIGRIDPTTFKLTEFSEKPLRPELANTACYVTLGRLNDFRSIERTPSNPEDELVHRWIKQGTIGGYIISHDSIISIKFEEDLTRVEDMDIEHFVRSAYETRHRQRSNPLH